MAVILRLIDICLFRADPSALPSDSRYMQLSALAYLLTGILINRLDSDWALSLSISITDIVILLVFVWLLLRGYRYLPRFNQSFLAITGCSVLLGILVMPLLALFYQYDESQQPASWLLLLLMAVMLWSLMVTAHILRRSLDCRPAAAVGWTVLYVVISIIGSGLVMSGIV